MPTARTLRLVACLGLLVACKDGGNGKDPGTNGSGDDISIYPDVGGQGTSLTVTLTSEISTFVFDDTTVDFGDGINVDLVQVLDGWNVAADITIAEDAELGEREVVAETGHSTLHVPDPFTVIDQSLSITPDYGLLGETVDVEILGRNTDWDPALTWASFGDGIDIIEFSVLSRSLATARLSIRADTWPGTRDVLMETGPDVVMLYEGFQVDRMALAAAFDPAVAEQGDTVTFTITARGTSFEDGLSELSFWKSGDEKSDILVDTITVLDATNLYGQMTLSNAAEIGSRDVLVTTGDEGVMIPDAFQVIDGDLNLEEVAVSMSFYVGRAIDNASCAVAEGVVGAVIFYIPLDPPCGSSPMGSGPQPYDVNGIFPIPESSEEDCPTPQTVGAGEHVWLESDANVVTLDRYQDSYTGMIYYTNPNLTLSDYVFDQWYDLHTEGEEGGVAEYLIEDIQPTVPADYELLTPAFCNDLTVSRASDFTYTWTPAQTYPDAFFSTSIVGTLVQTGTGGFAGCVPWDDGVHTYTSAELSELVASPVYFSASSYIEGVEFGLPDSIYQTNKTESTLYYQAYMVLE